MNNPAPHPDEKSSCELVAACGGFVTHESEEDFARVSSINLQGAKLTDDNLLMLSVMPKLTTMTLGYTEITDRGIEVLRRFESLSYLWLWGTGITDASYDTLISIPKLQLLNVEETKVTVGCSQRISSQIHNCLVCIDRNRAAMNGI